MTTGAARANADMSQNEGAMRLKSGGPSPPQVCAGPKRVLKTYSRIQFGLKRPGCRVFAEDATDRMSAEQRLN
jgi:hypothetical protein